MPSTFVRMFIGAALVIAPAAVTGCAVPQPKGNGKLQRIVEPTTRRGYWLYLPEAYVEDQGVRPDGRRWPLVVSFHGMKPFDDAHGQAREFGQEADNYGFIVCAPELLSSDLFGQFPRTKVDGTWQKDEEAILKIMDHVFATTNADPQNVLSTSWSYGGYFAHYMVNRHPHRFSCLAVRQSNFSSEILDEAQIPYYRQIPVAIFYGQNDFARTRLESQNAVAWYTQHGFPDMVSAVVVGRGHERIPQTAAAFFAEHTDVKPIKPWSAGSTLAAVTLQPQGSEPLFASPAAEQSKSRTQTAVISPGQQQSSPPPPVYQPTRSYQPTTPSVSRAFNRPLPTPRPAGQTSPEQPVRINCSADSVAVAPVMIAFQADLSGLPTASRQRADVVWSLDHVPFSNEIRGHKLIRQPGRHELSLLVTLKDGRSYQDVWYITVLEDLSDKSKRQASQ
jgi:poly(3-hydroxybutyrate) depolymerase